MFDSKYWLDGRGRPMLDLVLGIAFAKDSLLGLLISNDGRADEVLFVMLTRTGNSFSYCAAGGLAGIEA